MHGQRPPRTDCSILCPSPPVSVTGILAEAVRQQLAQGVVPGLAAFLAQADDLYLRGKLPHHLAAGAAGHTEILAPPRDHNAAKVPVPSLTALKMAVRSAQMVQGRRRFQCCSRWPHGAVPTGTPGPPPPGSGDRNSALSSIYSAKRIESLFRHALVLLLYYFPAQLTCVVPQLRRMCVHRRESFCSFLVGLRQLTLSHRQLIISPLLPQQILVVARFGDQPCSSIRMSLAVAHGGEPVDD